MSDAAASVGAKGFATPVRQTVTLVPSNLVVEAIEEDRLLFLEVRSRVAQTHTMSLTAASAVHRMAHQGWVADAEGVFGRVAPGIGGEERACTRLAAGQ